MKNLFLLVLIGLLTFSFMATDVGAKRFGGGKSFGVSRPMGNYSQTTRNAYNTSAANKPSMSKWAGPLAGLAIGGLLATLFMGHGLGSGLFTWLVIAVIIYFLWRLIKGRRQSSYSTFEKYNQSQSASNPSYPSFLSPEINPNQGQPVAVNADAEGFLRQAKSLFIRLQAAYDSKNLADIREFTTPEIFAEIQMQLQERGDITNYTEVVNLNAELLSSIDEVDHTSVLFSGLIREEQNAEPISIREIWHFQKNRFNSSWMVGGIEQQ